MVDIIKVHQEAQNESIYNPRVIDATIGVLLDEDGQIDLSKSVTQVLQSLKPKLLYPYAAVDGGITYRNHLINWLFPHMPFKNLYLDSIATPGGSGAIFLMLSLYKTIGEYVLTSDIRWQYDDFVSVVGMNILEHNLFDQHQFNLTDLKQKLDFLSTKQKRIIYILNDPCHNPTGYTLKKEELHALLTLFNQYPNHEIVLFYDLAYLEFETTLSIRDHLALLDTLMPHVITILGFSGSKTFGVYGLRMGGAVALSSNQQQIKAFYQNAYQLALGTWSAPPSHAITLFNELSISKESFLIDLSHMKALLIKRSTLFLKQANSVGLTIYPYQSGFYIMVPSTSPLEDYLLLKKHHIFLIPMKGGLRIAISSLSLEKIDGLAFKIKTLLSK